MKHASSGERRLHLCGLLSDGGVHSRQEHLYALLRMAKENGVESRLCALLHGRARHLARPGVGFIEQLQQKMRQYGVGNIATVDGRYYAMDRDRKWDRERKAFDAMVNGKSERNMPIPCRA